MVDGRNVERLDILQNRSSGGINMGQFYCYATCGRNFSNGGIEKADWSFYGKATLSSKALLGPLASENPCITGHILRARFPYLKGCL